MNPDDPSFSNNVGPLSLLKRGIDRAQTEMYKKSNFTYQTYDLSSLKQKLYWIGYLVTFFPWIDHSPLVMSEC